MRLECRWACGVGLNTQSAAWRLLTGCMRAGPPTHAARAADMSWQDLHRLRALCAGLDLAALDTTAAVDKQRIVGEVG